MTRQRVPDEDDLRSLLEAAERWSRLRADVIARIWDLHQPHQDPVTMAWKCQEDGQLYPCNTRKAGNQP